MRCTNMALVVCGANAMLTTTMPAILCTSRVLKENLSPIIISGLVPSGNTCSNWPHSAETCRRFPGWSSNKHLSLFISLSWAGLKNCHSEFSFPFFCGLPMVILAPNWSCPGKEERRSNDSYGLLATEMLPRLANKSTR